MFFTQKSGSFILVLIIFAIIAIGLISLFIVFFPFILLVLFILFLLGMRRTSIFHYTYRSTQPPGRTTGQTNHSSQSPFPGNAENHNDSIDVDFDVCDAEYKVIGSQSCTDEQDPKGKKNAEPFSSPENDSHR